MMTTLRRVADELLALGSMINRILNFVQCFSVPRRGRFPAKSVVLPEVKSFIAAAIPKASFALACQSKLFSMFLLLQLGPVFRFLGENLFVVRTLVFLPILAMIFAEFLAMCLSVRLPTCHSLRLRHTRSRWCFRSRFFPQSRFSIRSWFFPESRFRIWVRVLGAITLVLRAHLIGVGAPPCQHARISAILAPARRLAAAWVETRNRFVLATNATTFQHSIARVNSAMN